MFETLELILRKNADLRCTNLSNLCMEEIAFSKGFKKLKTLRILNLCCKIVGISQTAVTNLSCVIANNVGLEILNLSGNQLGENIAIIFGAMQHIYTHLRYINISNNQIPYKVTKFIAIVLENNQDLQVDISDNPSFL